MWYTERERDESGRNTAMAVGDRIKRVRNFRGMTMKELGMAVGFDEKSADVRIAHAMTKSGEHEHPERVKKL